MVFVVFVFSLFRERYDAYFSLLQSLEKIRTEESLFVYCLFWRKESRKSFSAHHVSFCVVVGFIYLIIYVCCSVLIDIWSLTVLLLMRSYICFLYIFLPLHDNSWGMLQAKLENISRKLPNHIWRKITETEKLQIIQVFEVRVKFIYSWKKHLISEDYTLISFLFKKKKYDLKPEGKKSQEIDCL